MDRHVVRLYTVAGALLVLFLVWTLIAASPWAPSTAAVADPRVTALEQREARIRQEAAALEQNMARRWALYREALAERTQQIASVGRRNAQARRASAPVAVAPPVRVVNLPPLTTSRSS